MNMRPNTSTIKISYIHNIKTAINQEKGEVTATNSNPKRSASLVKLSGVQTPDDETTGLSPIRDGTLRSLTSSDSVSSGRDSDDSGGSPALQPGWVLRVACLGCRPRTYDDV